MDSATRTLFLVGALVALTGLGALLVAQWTEIRWLIIPAALAWIAGAVVELVASGRYISGRRRAKGD